MPNIPSHKRVSILSAVMLYLAECGARLQDVPTEDENRILNLFAELRLRLQDVPTEDGNRILNLFAELRQKSVTPKTKLNWNDQKEKPATPVKASPVKKAAKRKR
jgi:hypothetical protein